MPAYIDDLSAFSGLFAEVLKNDSNLSRWLLYAVKRASEANVGIVFSVARSPFETTDLLYVNQDLLTLLSYPSQAAYAAALAAGTLIHPDDATVVNHHILAASTASYDARMLRGDGSGNYRRMRIQGMTHRYSGDGVDYRVTILTTV